MVRNSAPLKPIAKTGTTMTEVVLTEPTLLDTTDESPVAPRIATNTERVAAATKATVQRASKNALSLITNREQRNAAKAALYRELLPVMQLHADKLARARAHRRALLVACLVTASVAAGAIAWIVLRA